MHFDGHSRYPDYHRVFCFFIKCEVTQLCSVSLLSFITFNHYVICQPNIPIPDSSLLSCPWSLQTENMHRNTNVNTTVVCVLSTSKTCLFSLIECFDCSCLEYVYFGIGVAKTKIV